MAGLVGYASSDEEEEEVVDRIPEKGEAKVDASSTTQPTKLPQPSQEEAVSSSTEPTQPVPQPQPAAPSVVGPSPQPPSTPMGPSLPPGPSDAAYLPEPDEEVSAPSSPYSTTRNLLRDLTLPTHPNLDIPPSPPGSPPPALNKKFEQFLDLKKKGVHFNTKLANSTALRNPSLMDKLMGFIDMGPEDGSRGLRGQYATTLPADVWDPTGPTFPDWASRGPLRESQERVRKEREAERAAAKRAPDFVRSVSSTPVGSGNEAGGLSRGSKRKAGAL